MVPIVLITGFLGSGKTTFLNWLLEKHPDTKASIILNEFGDIKLESQFVRRHSEDVMELANGCMCCVAKSDIPRVIRYLLEHSPQTEYILIEASGLSDPDPVREALQTAPVSAMAYLECTVCIIDAVNFEKMRTEHPIISSQIADADLVILNKIEMAGQAQVTTIQSHIQSLTPDVRVLQFTDELPVDIFMTTAAPHPDVLSAGPKEHHHTHEHYDIYWYESADPLELNKLIDVVRNLPAEIIRIKGVVTYLSDGETHTASVQRVGSHLTVQPHAIMQPNGTSAILFIGKSIDQEEVQRQMRNCRTIESA